jgi:hypothetical protein
MEFLLRYNNVQNNPGVSLRHINSSTAKIRDQTLVKKGYRKKQLPAPMKTTSSNEYENR